MDPQASNGRKSVRILVVDDYPHMADYLAKILCKKEYTAITAYSAEEALRVAEQFSPHALIADLMMPEMNGTELACAFAEKFPTCRIVLMTAERRPNEIFIRGLRIKVFEKTFEFPELFDYLDSGQPS